MDAIAVGDFNGDGMQDIATASFTSDLRAYAGLGDGTFAPFADFPSAPFGQYLVAADFNGDGKTDLAMATGLQIKVLLTGGGTTTIPIQPTSLSATLGAGGARSITYSDAGGYTARLTLTGPGSATVNFQGANLGANASGSLIVGGTATLTSIAATGTTAGTVLTIDPLGKNGRITIGSITTDGSFARIVAPRVSLSGNVTIPGTAGGLELNNLSGGAVTLGSPGAEVDLSLGNVSDETLASAQPIGVLNAGQWASDGAAVSRITAPSARKIAIVGTFAPDLTLTAGGLGSFLATAFPVEHGLPRTAPSAISPSSVTPRSRPTSSQSQP